MPKPIEKPPTGPRLPPFWHAKHNSGIPYRPKDKPFQEDWHTVARKFDVDVKDLIWFNFQTNDPAEVNWYLRNHTGCSKVSPSGNNWMFSNSANPGIIYIPPAEDTTITFEPEEMCSWTPDQTSKFMQRLRDVSQSMTGHKWARIKKLVQVILRVGHPLCLKLWYYNDMNVTAYVDFKTTGAKLREMTKATQGAYPFDGASGLYRQSGTAEQNRGMWRIHAVKDLFDEFGCTNWKDDDIKSRLESIDNLMYKGWYEMSLVEFKTHHGGGSAYNEAVGNFIDHVTYLTKDSKHLYWAFR